MFNLKHGSFRHLSRLLLALAIAGCGTTAQAGLGSKVATRLKSRSVDGLLTLFKEPDDGVKPILDALDGAKTTIDFKIYMMTMSGPAGEVVDALARAKARGVRVRVLIEAFPYAPENRAVGQGGINHPAVDALVKAGVDVAYSRPQFRYTHEKTITIDGTTTIIMTCNITKSSFSGNREYGIIDKRPLDVDTVQRIFDADWLGQPPQMTYNPNIVTSPYNSRAQLLALVSQAQKSLVFETNSFEDPDLVRIAGQKAAAGVDVQVEVPFSRDSDAGTRNQRVADTLARAGIRKVRFMKANYLHAKLIVADGMEAYVGSENLTANSLDNNREMGLLLQDPDLVNNLLATANADFGLGMSLDGPAQDASGSQPVTPVVPVSPLDPAAGATSSISPLLYIW